MGRNDVGSVQIGELRNGYPLVVTYPDPTIRQYWQLLFLLSGRWPIPVECGRSRLTTRRSNLADWAEYGYYASHSRYFWGLRLHLVATPSGLPIAYALAPATADERDTALGMIAHGRLARPGQTLIADKGYRRASFEKTLNQAGMTLIRPATKTQAARPGRRFLRSCHQIIESVNNTFKTQLDLERHGRRTRAGVIARLCLNIPAALRGTFDPLHRTERRTRTGYLRPHLLAPQRLDRNRGPVGDAAELAGDRRRVPGVTVGPPARAWNRVL